MTSISQLLSALFLSLVNLTVIVSAQTFEGKIGKDCISDSNRKVVSARSGIECAIFCFTTSLCQSYKMSGQECHLFFYTKTSHKVNKEKICTASDEIIWVKKESYKECPAGFGHEFYGTKYKLVTAGKSQYDAIAYCQSLGVNSRLADALDLEELSHLVNITTGLATIVWLDGAQVAGSVEPAGGWKWTAAGVDVDPSMWMSGQPDNGGGNEHSACLYVPEKKLADFLASYTYPSSICECNAVLN